MMTARRRLLRTLGAMAIGWPLAARSQAAAKIPRVGYLSVGSPGTNGAFLLALKDALRELGYVEGRNIAFDIEGAGGRAYEFPKLAASVVRRKPDAIVVPVDASSRDELPGAFASMKEKNADAVIVMTEAFIAGQVDVIVPLAERYRLPAIYGFREFAEAGGLMSYGLSYRDY